MIWRLRYWLAQGLISAGLWVLPRGRYRDELLDAMYGLRDRVIDDVLAYRKAVAAGAEGLPTAQPEDTSHEPKGHQP